MIDAASLADHARRDDLRLHGLEAYANADTATEARRLLVKSQSDVSFDAAGNRGFPAEAAESVIENMVDSIQVPIDVAGPVSVDGDSIVGERYFPFAITEGAPLASVNRGCSVISSTSGVTVRVLKSGMIRTPVFRVADIAEAEAPVSWTRDNFAALKEAAEETTNHSELLDVIPCVVGNSVYLRSHYGTKDAMGMNMAIITTEAVCGIIEAEAAASLVALSGNLYFDKKPAAINAVEGCDRSVTADVRIPRGVVEGRLHTASGAVAEPSTCKNLVGPAKAANLGSNAHVTNIIAAMFFATGQDEAQVVEGASAITTAEAQDGDLYISVSIAFLEVSTVGDGMKPPTQSEGLDVLGVDGGGNPASSNAGTLAECITVGSFMGKLSLLSALVSRHLSSAHAELGR